MRLHHYHNDHDDDEDDEDDVVLSSLSDVANKIVERMMLIITELKKATRNSTHLKWIYWPG